MIKDFHKTAIVMPTHEVSYDEMLRRIRMFADVTLAEHGDRVLIFAENREAWIYAFFAAWTRRCIAVPVDASNTVDDMAYILGDCQPTVVWTSVKRADTLREAISALPEDVERPRVMVMDVYERRELTDQQQARIEYDPDDTAVIIYTSGTTGDPKGVMLSHASLIANQTAVSRDVPIFTPDRRTLILLPLHHVLPLQGTLIMPIVIGAGVAMCPSLSGPEIMATLQKGRVAIFLGVPRLWQTLFGGIKKKLDSNFVTRFLFWMCRQADNAALSRVVFGKVHKMMGGNIKIMVSGGAALDREIGEGMKALGFTMLEGYGMTETAPIITFTRPGEVRPGCVGRALPGVDIKLVDGELCAKGPNLMQGYWRKPEETAQVIDADGYIHTGDLATMDKDGFVTITGRTKELIVLSNGKNVQPAEIEYKLEKYDVQVKEAAVLQQGDMLCAIIVPQKEWAGKLSDQEAEEALKEQVLRPYNLETENYKKIMRLFVYRDELPRTRMDKLQRFKLAEIVESGEHHQTHRKKIAEPTWQEYQILKKYIQDEKGVKLLPTDHIETDLGFDSLDKVGLQTFIEQSFGAKVDAASMASFPNIAAMAEHVADQKTRMSVENVDWKETLQTTGTPMTLPTSTVMMPLAVKGLKGFFRLYNRLSFVGQENIPAHGPIILAPNHQSYVDAGVVMSGVKWSQIQQYYFYATEDHVRSATRRRLASHSNVVLMERKNLKDSIQKLAQVLQQGKDLIIFPEGSRTHTGEVGVFKKTFAILSKELDVAVVPVCIRGAFEALPRHRRWLRPGKIVVEYLPAVKAKPDQTAEQLSEQVRKAIVEALHKE